MKINFRIKTASNNQAKGNNIRGLTVDTEDITQHLYEGQN